MADDYKYHIAHHASLVPPPELVDARTAYGAGALDGDALEEVQERAIREVLRMQRRIGISALSDGEFRRRNGIAPVYDGIEGFADQPSAGSAFAELVGPMHAPEIRELRGTPSERGRLVKSETDFVASVVDRPVLVALPSPGFVAELSAGGSGVDVATSGAELARILRKEVAALAADDVRHVLLRNPAYGFLLTHPGRDRAAALGIDVDATLERMAAADALVLDDMETPEPFRVSLDLTTAGAVRGPYVEDVVEQFLAGLPVGRLCVEFPADPGDRFPIALLAPGTVVSIGIIDVGQPAAEDVDELVQRVDEAAKDSDIDDIALATNGGFHAARTMPNGVQQHAKLQLVEMVARYFWGNEL